MSDPRTINALLIRAWKEGNEEGFRGRSYCPYESPEFAIHEDWCHWGQACCGCKCGAVDFGYDDPSIKEAEDED